MVFANREACEFIESDLFKLLITDATAYMVWSYMGYSEYMEIYSGYDPAWKLAHCPDYWIGELTVVLFPQLKSCFKIAMRISDMYPKKKSVFVYNILYRKR